MRPHRYGHKQRLPQWARAALHPSVRDKLNGELRTWRATLQNDPCSYCAGPGGEADHIVARRSGGRDRWLNLAGACDRCNRAKGSRPLLAFLAGLHLEIDLGGAVLADFGGLRVATANLDKATGSSQPDRWGTRDVLEALLRARPDAEGALGYRQRHQGRGRRPAWIHVLATPAGAPTPEQYAGGSAEAAPERGAAPRAANRSSQQSTKLRTEPETEPGETDA